MKNENYNGWTNRDTWAVMLWLNNDYENYQKITRIVNNTNKLQDLNDNELFMELKNFHYGDKINFNNINLDEIRQALIEE